MSGRQKDGQRRPIRVRIAIIPIMALLFASGAEGETSRRRGAFAFHYAPALTDERLAWYSHFELLVTHDPLPRDQVARLHAAGTKLLLYEWAVAFYDSRATEWHHSLLSHRKRTLLNETPLTGGVGSSTAGAWYFDPMSREHQSGRASEIARRLEQFGYDGVFLDTTTVESLHAEARKEYERRHPETPYDVAFSRFLSRLRKRLPKAVIFTNQGYRSADAYLPYVDWDLTESLITWPRDGAFRIRPWNDHAEPWNSSYFLMRNLIEPVADRYPRVRFGHLNYIDDTSPETIRLVVALAQIFSDEGFVAAPTLSGEADSIYFRDPGKPISDRIDAADGTVTHRFFDRGMIAVTAAKVEITIENPYKANLRNRVTGELYCGRAITLPPSTGDPLAIFFDNTSDCDAGR